MTEFQIKQIAAAALVLWARRAVLGPDDDADARVSACGFARSSRRRRPSKKPTPTLDDPRQGASLSLIKRAARSLRRAFQDWRPFWSELGEHLADTAQARWPLRRRSGKLRKSLVWSRRQRLGPWRHFRGIRKSARIRERTVFYSGNSRNTAPNKQQADGRCCIRIDETDIGQRLALWAKSRAAAAGIGGGMTAYARSRDQELHRRAGGHLAAEGGAPALAWLWPVARPLARYESLPLGMRRLRCAECDR